MQGHPRDHLSASPTVPTCLRATLFEISEVLRVMGEDARPCNAYYLSVDPERDTAAAIKEYLSSFDPRLKGLAGNPDQIAKVLSETASLCQEGPVEGRRTTPWTTPR